MHVIYKYHNLKCGVVILNINYTLSKLCYINIDISALVSVYACDIQLSQSKMWYGVWGKHHLGMLNLTILTLSNVFFTAGESPNNRLANVSGFLF